MAITPMYVEGVFDMTIVGEGATAVFRVQEDISSRGIDGESNVVYDVDMIPNAGTPIDTQFSTAINLSDGPAWADFSGSEELIIAANVWNLAGWSHMDGQSVKKWPPTCTRTGGPNQFRVVIKYEPLFVVNFDIGNQKAKKLSSDDVEVWEPNGADGYTKKNISTLSYYERMSYHNFHDDGKGKVNGIDVLEPYFTWDERWTFGPVKSLVVPGEDRNYTQEITDTVGTLNQEKFRGFPPESVMLLNCRGRNINYLTWEFDYRFQYRPKQTEIKIGYKTLKPGKEFQSGWHHADTTEGQEAEGADSTPRNASRIVKIHKIHEAGHFGFLKIASDTGTDLPFGYGTPLDKLEEIPTIGTPWKLPVWATKS